MHAPNPGTPTGDRSRPGAASRAILADVHTGGRRRRISVAVAVVLLLALGWVTADQLTGALKISAQPVTVPEETLVAAPAPEPAPAYATVPTVSVPGGDALLDLAATTYAKALGARTGTRPRVVIGAGDAGGTTVRLEASAGTGAQGYRLARGGGGLVVEAQDRRGAAAGLFQLADRISAGRALPAYDGTVVTPSLGLRLLDAGAIGVQPDPDAWRAGDDYSHNSKAFADAILPDAPYVDEAALADDEKEFRAFVDHGLAQGYNGLVVNGFLEYVTFSGVGDGNEVYAAGDPHRERALAMQRTFGPMLKYAHDMGMTLVLKTDMLALTTPLEDYLTRELGGIKVDDPRLWDVYRAGLDELLTAMPYVDSVMVRIGEAGKIYDLPGWDYYSALSVTTVPAVRAMLEAFTAVGDERGKDIIFRSWSVGVGEVGDMHTDPATYAKVLDGIDSPHLVVSTKYSLGDFYSHLPLNTTLEGGTQRRIVELQGRREFEAYGSLPNDLTVLHQEALQQFVAANPKVEGIWLWTQDGGPWRAGPMSLYLTTGFWQLYDLSAYAAGRLAWDLDARAADITSDWARRTCSDDPATVAAITSAMALSREAISKGLYIGPYADKKVLALGLEPPPMMWIFEWDIVTGDSAVLGSIYDTSKGDLDRAFREADEAVAVASRMRSLVTATDASTWRTPELRQHFLDTLDYEVDLFTTLGAYRTMVLRHEQWLDTGDASAREAWSAARTSYVAARDAHVARWAGNLDLPAYEFTAADIGLERAERDLPMAWVARVLLVLLVGLVLLGSRFGQRLLREGSLPGASALAGAVAGAADAVAGARTGRRRAGRPRSGVGRAGRGDRG